MRKYRYLIKALAASDPCELILNAPATCKADLTGMIVSPANREMVELMHEDTRLWELGTQGTIEVHVPIHLAGTFVGEIQSYVIEVPDPIDLRVTPPEGVSEGQMAHLVDSIVQFWPANAPSPNLIDLKIRQCGWLSSRVNEKVTITEDGRMYEIKRLA